jgi:hypothetical protein
VADELTVPSLRFLLRTRAWIVPKIDENPKNDFQKRAVMTQFINTIKSGLARTKNAT